MTLTLTIDNAAEATRMVDGYCNATGWTSGSGVTKAQWTKDHLAAYLKQTAKRGEFKADAAAISAAIDAIVVY